MKTSGLSNDLEFMFKDMDKQDSFYKPTAFWKKAQEILVKDIVKKGLESFRAGGAACDFFVPTYGTPGNGLSSEFIAKLQNQVIESYGEGSKAHLTLMRELSGEAWAHADFRTVVAGDLLDTPPNISNASESKVGNPKEHFNFEGRFFSRSFLNYLQGLVFLKRNVPTNSIKKVIEIGGGFGTLGEILHQAGAYSYVDVDIPLTAAVAQFYLSSIDPHKVIPYRKTCDLGAIECPESGHSMVLCPWQLPRLKGPFDLAVNFISFQEMEPEVVQNYLNEIDRLESTYVLLRNLREGKKTLAQGAEYGVETPVLGDDYDRFLANYQLLAKNDTPYGYVTVDGFHSELRLYRRR